jgi:hypothetical protein
MNTYLENMETENFKPEDIPQKIVRVIQIPKLVFVISLTTGTLLLLAYLLTRDSGLIGIGIYYVAFAIIVNTGTLISVTVCAFRYPKHKSLILGHTPILLLNIPIVWVYVMIVANVMKL